MSNVERTRLRYIPKEPVSSRGYEVNIVLMRPVIDLQLLDQRCVDQDNDLQAWCYLEADNLRDNLPGSLSRGQQ